MNNLHFVSRGYGHCWPMRLRNNGAIALDRDPIRRQSEMFEHFNDVQGSRQYLKFSI